MAPATLTRFHSSCDVAGKMAKSSNVRPPRKQARHIQMHRISRTCSRNCGFARARETLVGIPGKLRTSASRARSKVQCAVAALAALAAANAAEAQQWGPGYFGIFAGAGSSANSLVDVEGYANSGNPGWVTEYDGSGSLGGLLIGTSFGAGRLPLRLEMGLGVGSMTAETDLLDPEGRDESAIARYHWISTLRFGLEYPFPKGGVYFAGGLAFAEISNSATDIDGEIYVDPDDSFSDTSVATGTVFGIGAEFQMNENWRMRIEGSQYDFGTTTFEVNRSANNNCGDAGLSPCPYEVSNRLQAVSLAFIHYFN